MSISTHNPSLSPSASPPIPLRPLPRAAEPARPKRFVDAVQFTGKPSRKEPEVKKATEAGFFSGERLTGAWRSLKHDLTSKDWWFKNGAIAAAVTLATCWLPGSQLFTIPLWLGIDAMFSAMKGHQHYQHPRAQNTPATPQATDGKPWSGKDKRKAAWKGLKQGAKDGFCKDFGKKALISGALCLATCWLPGSQLILIPGLFCSFAAWEGVKNAFEGYENPETYLKPPSQQARKTQAQ